MKKLAGLLYDVTDFVTASKIDQLVEITKGKDELVKNARVHSLEEMESIPNEQCALIMYHPHLGTFKKLAMTDKYITELNMRIFEDRIDSLPEEIVKIASYYLAKGAKHFRLSVPEKIQKYASEKQATNWINISTITATTPLVKKAEKAQEYALNGKYPISTPELIKQAINYFDTHRSRFSPMNAITYAANVKVAADKSNVSYTNTLISKYAQLDPTHFNDSFEVIVRARKGFALEDQRSAYDDLITESKNLGVIKTAEVLEELDRITGVSNSWNNGVEDPIFTVMAIKKVAFTKFANKTVTAEHLKKVSKSLVDDGTYNELQGPDAVDVFESLPTPVKRKIVEDISIHFKDSL